MADTLVHRIDLYPPQEFKTLLEHEVSRSHRYGDSLTLIHMMIETGPATPEHQHEAEALVIDALGSYLRHADVSCKQENEFLILLPATGVPGARTACERIKKMILARHAQTDKPGFQLQIFFGIAMLPNDDQSVTSTLLAQHAEQALQHARSNRITSVVNFSDVMNHKE